MNPRFYRLTRDLHFYFGLFISPFVLIFAVSVFFLVHSWKSEPQVSAGPTVTGLSLPEDIEALSGRRRIERLKPVLEQMGVHGEVGWVEHFPKLHRLVIPVTVPGRVTKVTLDTRKREASLERRTTGLADALVGLHMSPGQHLADIRKNWFYMRLWSWLADATVYFTLFITVSGLYLWYLLRAERKAGLILLGAGALSFSGIVYALCY